MVCIACGRCYAIICVYTNYMYNVVLAGMRCRARNTTPMMKRKMFGRLFVPGGIRTPVVFVHLFRFRVMARSEFTRLYISSSVEFRRNSRLVV